LKGGNDATDYGTIPTLESSNVENLKITLNQICSKIASRYNLYSLNGEPRRAAIIAALANSECPACIARRLGGKAAPQSIDAIYKECHRLAVNVLIEELYNLLNRLGYTVSITSEAEMEYCTADVLIKLKNYGINLRCGATGLMIEIKTGTSLSIDQLLRHLLDAPNATVIVWRVRRRQVLAFDGRELEPLLIEFMRTCILRGKRLLQSPNVLCDHPIYSSRWSPTENQIEEMFKDFAAALVETRKHVIEAIFEKLGMKKDGLSHLEEELRDDCSEA